jgi:hypothetical protein
VAIAIDEATAFSHPRAGSSTAFRGPHSPDLTRAACHYEAKRLARERAQRCFDLLAKVVAPDGTSRPLKFKEHGDDWWDRMEVAPEANGNDGQALDHRISMAERDAQVASAHPGRRVKIRQATSLPHNAPTQSEAFPSLVLPRRLGRA